MKQNMVKLWWLSLVLIFFAGCGRIVDWAKDQVPQGKILVNDTRIAQGFVRSYRCYDQFTLLGSFDAIPLTNGVRATVHDMITKKYAVDPAKSALSLQRQIEENNQYLVFYLLMLIDQPLGGESPIWSVFLTVDNATHYPSEIKETDLPLEYQLIFGKKYSVFKRSYRITFDAKDVDGKFIVSQYSDELALVFRSLKKEVKLIWQLEDGQIIKGARCI